MRWIRYGLFTIVLVLIVSFSPRVLADDFNSANFKIQFGNVNMGSCSNTDPSNPGACTSAGYKLESTLGQTSAEKMQFGTSGYIVKAGFQYIHSIIPFRFAISAININLGTLVPNTPSTATTNLTVSFGSAGQYIVTATEVGKLQTFTGSSSIPDATCDGGTCTETSAETWSSASAYGFGYNMSGNDIPADFTGSTKYRPFADETAGESPATVMSNVDVGANRQSTVTFKANISNVQPAGSYQTIIKFTATPSF